MSKDYFAKIILTTTVTLRDGEDASTLDIWNRMSDYAAYIVARENQRIYEKQRAVLEFRGRDPDKDQVMTPFTFEVSVLPLTEETEDRNPPYAQGRVLTDPCSCEPINQWDRPDWVPYVCPACEAEMAEMEGEDDIDFFGG